MESRNNNFIIVEPIAESGELQHNSIIQKINVIIAFINNNHYRRQDEKDQDYLKKYPEATLSGDIKLREKLALTLKDQKNISVMITEVNDALKKKYNKRQDQEKKYDRFRDIADKFLTHIEYAHLTAAELAIVGMSIDTLLILLPQARNNMSDDEALQQIAEKQRELLKIRDKLAACMAYHKSVFTENNEKDFIYSDIIINLYNAIEYETDIKLDEDRKGLWPDMSYLQILPPVPFYKQTEPKTVAQYFAEYSELPPPGFAEVDQLADEIKHELRLLDEEEKVPTVEISPVSTPHASCFSPWSIFSRSNNIPVTIAQPAANLLEDWDEVDIPLEIQIDDDATETKTMDDIIRLMESFNEKAKQEIKELQFFDELRGDINKLRNQLHDEIIELQKPSCFSFFYTGTLNKKIAKYRALGDILDGSSIVELSRRAKDQMTAANSGLVLAGLRSRTEAMFKRLIRIGENHGAFVHRYEL